MKRFIQGEHRGQSTLLPESLDDYVSDTNPVRVVDVFVDELDLVNLGFDGAIPADTGRPAYKPAILLKIYIYGYLNRIQSSRRLEREAQRNVELMWLIGRLMPDFKTIANFRKDNSKAIRRAYLRGRLYFLILNPSAFLAQPTYSNRRRFMNNPIPIATAKTDSNPRSNPNKRI